MERYLEWIIAAYAILLHLCNLRLSRRIKSMETTVKELSAKLHARDEDAEQLLIRNQIKINQTIAATVARCLEPYNNEQKRQGALLAQVHDVLVSVANKVES